MKGRLLKLFYKGSSIQNKLPANVKEKDLSLFKSLTTINLPASGLYSLKNVFVTDLGIIYKNFFSLKENIICYDLDFKNYKFRYLLKSFLKFKKTTYTGNKALIIFDNYSGPQSFAHWLCDGLTRLAELNNELSEYTVLVPYYFKTDKLYSESLKFFNISSMYYLEKNSITRFKKLFFPSPVSQTGNFNPENLIKLKNIIIPKLGLTTNHKKNIYISRSKAKRRFVKNELEVIESLSKSGFENYCLEDFSLAEQIAIIKNSANIISIHGAALCLLMFADEGTSVMELRADDDTINNMYYLLAEANNLNYYYIGCESFLNKGVVNDFDLNVNMNELEISVKEMLNK